MMKNNLETDDFQFNVTVAENVSSGGPDLHVFIIVGFVLVILVVLAAIGLFKYMSRLVYNWRRKRAEEALMRAINIYNSQEPLEEPDLVYIRPGDQSSRQSAKSPRSESEIAFVHSDGRIERFRPLVGSNSYSGHKSLATRKQHRYKSEAKLNSREPQNCHVTGDKEAYAAFQPLCVKLESVPAYCLGADLRDTVSLGGCDIPPSYEEALEMPVAPNTDHVMIKSSRSNAVGRTLDLDYYNVKINKQSGGKRK